MAQWVKQSHMLKDEYYFFTLPHNWKGMKIHCLPWKKNFLLVLRAAWLKYWPKHCLKQLQVFSNSVSSSRLMWGRQLKYSHDCFFHILPNTLLTNYPKNLWYIILIIERIITKSTNKQINNWTCYFFWWQLKKEHSWPWKWRNTQKEGNVDLLTGNNENLIDVAVFWRANVYSFVLMGTKHRKGVAYGVTSGPTNCNTVTKASRQGVAT
jgi:hypothetical protein